MPFTKIVQVGAFTDDVARQINDNFALLTIGLMAHGIDVDKEKQKQHDEAMKKLQDEQKKHAEEEDVEKQKSEGPAEPGAKPKANQKPEGKHADHK